MADRAKSRQAHTQARRPGTRQKRSEVEKLPPAKPRPHKATKPAKPSYFEDLDWQSPERWDGIFG